FLSDLYLLNICSSATNRIITAKDHASVQLFIGHIDDCGIYDLSTSLLRVHV
ncbi:hypothetical protein MKX03_028225, partial [Papaver bracteatum]